MNKETQIKHKMRGTRFYSIWKNMRSRCNNKKKDNYKYYGGRGIRVCKRWDQHQNFKDDMYESYLAHEKNNKTTQLDRIDNRNGYSKENCRWLTNKENCRNTRRNHLLIYKGKTKCLTEWAEDFNIKPKTLFARLIYGWGIERALKTSVRNNKKHG